METVPKITELQMKHFLEDGVANTLLLKTAQYYKNIIVDTAPEQIEVRENAYLMYHAVQSLFSEMDKAKQEILLIQMEREFDQQQVID